jgi:hypothetical protein
MNEMRKEENTNPLPEIKKEEVEVNKNRFVLKLKTKLPENPSYNDLVVWCIARKNISISQKEFAELPVTVQAFFEIK